MLPTTVEVARTVFLVACPRKIFFQVLLIFLQVKMDTIASIFRPLMRLLHLVIVSLIRAYKYLELQFLRIIAPSLETQLVRLGKRLGVVFHFTENGDIYSPESWTPKQEAVYLARCAPKYDSLIHLQLNNKREFISRGANTWGLGIAETYMEHHWDSPQGDEAISIFFKRLLENNFLRYYLHPINRLILYLELYMMNLQTRTKSAEVIDMHYDLGNDLYEAMLDPKMVYTCGYWANTNKLDEAQINKMDLIGRKLKLKPGMRVLDIGCGWGSLCKYLAENFGVECVGVTISDEQLSYAKDLCKGLKVEIRRQDYRDVNEKFDRIVVVGMIEHVGFHNYDEFFKIAHRNLKDDGIFLLHTIGLNHADVPRTEPFLHTYVFPNGNLPFPGDITKVSHGRFIIEDWHNFGPDYSKTLKAWRTNFCRNWSTIEHKYGEKFHRFWTYYLSFSAGIFDARRAQLWQIVFSKEGVQPEYRSLR